MPTITPFNPSAHHIRFVGSILSHEGLECEFRAILDTGAPRTEFSDQFLFALGMLPDISGTISTTAGLQTQKYSKITVSHLAICGHTIQKLIVNVSHFEKNWGVDALIGLDFFRLFKTTIDYQSGHVITDPF